MNSKPDVGGGGHVVVSQRVVCPFCGERMERDEQRNGDDDRIAKYTCTGCEAETGWVLEPD